MTRGRKPKPTRVKELQGNPGKRKIKKAGEPKPRSNNVDVAKLIGIGDLSRAFLDKYAPLLKVEGLLTDIDQPALELMGEHYAIAVKAADIVEHEGLKTKDDHGLMRKHPLLSVFRDNAIAFRNYAAEFGMTPSARSRFATETDQLSFAEKLLEQEFFGDGARVRTDDTDKNQSTGKGTA
jgi:P27 family predicted phage terminase small subunit